MHKINLIKFNIKRPHVVGQIYYYKYKGINQ